MKLYGSNMREELYIEKILGRTAYELMYQHKPHTLDSMRLTLETIRGKDHDTIMLAHQMIELGKVAIDGWMAESRELVKYRGATTRKGVFSIRNYDLLRVDLLESRRLHNLYKLTVQKELEEAYKIDCENYKLTEELKELKLELSKLRGKKSKKDRK